MSEFTECCCISNEEAHKILKEMGYEAKIQELEQKLKEREWISVKDRLPDKCGKYLTCNKNDDYVVWCFDKENEKFGCADYGYEAEVTHWMPLPQKPESEDDANGKDDRGSESY